MRSLRVSKGLRHSQKPLISVARCQQRAYNAAVIGGGITGLTAAWQLAQDPQCSGITLYEKSDRLGGWLRSETIPVQGGNVVFEYGPRTLRSAMPASLPLLYLISNLGLLGELITTSKRSPAALNRYIYYPDHLVRLPTPDPALSVSDNIRNVFRALMNEPLFEGLLPALILEHTKPARPPSMWQSDESVSQFISRRFNSHVAENLVSAVMHGIYAGDIDGLSAQALLGGMRNLEDGGILYSLITNSILGKKTRLMDDFLAVDAIAKSPEALDQSQDIFNVIKTASTFTFKRGTQQLIEGLVGALQASSKITIKTKSEITTMKPLDPGPQSKLKITTPETGIRSYDRVIATVPVTSLTKILDSELDAKQKKAIQNNSKPLDLTPLQFYLHGHNEPGTTVMVVNLYYSNPNLLPVEGFGYLIPRSIPYEQNPECGLGVIFASSSSVGTSAVAPYESVAQDTAPGTKITVMFGGWYWDHLSPEDYPDHDTAIRMARTMLQRHIGITDAPTVARSSLQKDAIPQYRPAHLGKMYNLSNQIRDQFHRRLILAGNSWTGVGVGDCVRQGILAATHGVGRHQLRVGSGEWYPWKEYDYQNWDLEGGIPTAPVRHFESSI
ncbi:hypothetical protein N7462_010536 [Penicillium macrosclerotiorum]|uniref:uncharacterized protein n=1 Tax=Penicillium macrosclerotiorum TaxID=303699 RepID=UPI0025467AB9|nr:uncharacterized protein N7462_010536 [Penicillium macrosclerotiorum]KAJ5669466.1 hypothetical protein N7462_010536 [Penicillium macrosclerotiorum]